MLKIDRRFVAILVFCMLLVSIIQVANANNDGARDVAALNAQLRQLLSEGKVKEAIPVAQAVARLTENTFGVGNSETAISFNNLGALYMSAGQNAQAEDSYKRALNSATLAYGNQSPELSPFLGNLGTFYLEIGDFSQAEPLVARAVALAESAKKIDFPNLVLRLNDLSTIYEKKENNSDAEKLLKKALEICDKKIPMNDSRKALTLFNLSVLYFDVREYQKAKFFARRELAITENAQPANDIHLARSLTNLGRIDTELNDFVHAEALLRRALSIDEEKLQDDTGTMKVSQALGDLYIMTGAYNSAEPFYVHALAIKEATFGPDAQETAFSLNDLGELYHSMGKYNEAEPQLERALAIRERYADRTPFQLAISLDNLAELYMDMGAYVRASELLQRARKIFEKVVGPENPDRLTNLNNIGLLYFTIGEYSQAEPIFSHVLQTRKKILGEFDPHVALSYNNLAALKANVGAIGEARELYKKSLIIYMRIFGPDHPYTAMALGNLATLDEAEGNYSSAEVLYKRVLDVQRPALGEQHPMTIGTLNNLAAAEWAEGKWKEAAILLERAASATEQMTTSILAVGGESRKQSFEATLDGATDADLTFSMAAQSRVANIESLGIQVVLQRKGRVLDVLADSFATVKRSLAPADRRLFESWRNANTQYAELLFRGPERLSREQYKLLLDQSNNTASELESELSQRSAEFREQTQSVTVDRVQHAIPEKAALVEWYRYTPFNARAVAKQSHWASPRYVAFVLARDSRPVAVDVGDADNIDAKISTLLSALRDPSSSTSLELARELDVQLMQPLRPYLRTVDRIFLSPDGLLNLLPFGVLVDEEGRYLIQSTELTYVTSGRDLLRIVRAPSKNSEPVLIGDPAFGSIGDISSQAGNNENLYRHSADFGKSALQFMRLPGTAAEIDAIQKILGLSDQQVLLEDKASKSALEQLHSPRMLHLATHGFFLPDQMSGTPTPFYSSGNDWMPARSGENPLLRSGLALAGANHLGSGQDDGILTALEAAGLDLTGTQLVVLSACETGAGLVKNGQGVYGLRRAMVLAGVQTQVTSLWKVEDAATIDLMTDYYRHLSVGIGRSAALRNAQLAMLADTTHPERRHPFYWASFIAIGDDSPLQITDIKPKFVR